MKSRFTTLLLFVTAVLLGAFILVFEHDTETSYERASRLRTVFAVYPDSINQLIFERGGVTIECRKINGEWRMTAPVHAAVDQLIISRMISGMARVERGELLSPASLKERNLSAADYGFDEPRAKITYRTEQNTGATWLIGRDSPLDNMLYVKSIDSDVIIFAPQTLLHLVPENPAWIRYRILFSGESTAVRGIDIRRTAGLFQLRRLDTGTWQIQQPYTGRADLPPVHAFTEKILGARIRNFIVDEKTDLVPFGLTAPVMELSMFTQDQRIQTLRIGDAVDNAPEERYAKYVDSDSVFTVSSEWVNEIETAAGTLRSPLLTDLPAERITALKVTRGERLVELMETNGAWQIVRPAHWDADPEKVIPILQRLAAAPIQEFIDAPSADQTLRVQNAPWIIEFSDGEKTGTLRVSAPGTNDLRLAQYNNEPAIYAVAAGIIPESLADPLSYRKRVVLNISPAAIETISVRISADSIGVHKNESGGFVADAAGEQVVPAALTSLMWELNNLQVERYVAFNPESLTMYGLENPAVHITVTLGDTHAIGHILLIGDATEGGYYAMLQGQNTVFILLSESVEILTARLTKPVE
ncbi:MAG: DUF4340 domain-containing protein [Kiritimatiellales bacterium]